MINEKDIEHLAGLARLEIPTTNVGPFAAQIGEILNYVQDIQKISNAAGDSLSKKGPVKNVARADEVTNAPGKYTKAILDSAPVQEAGFIAVKKILS
jgi:aspartyl-tRNA(Asn)/glutamyl-tRNA(Gln) amidotransferase subunit C